MTTSLALDIVCHSSFADIGHYQCASNQKMERVMHRVKERTLVLLIAVFAITFSAGAEVGGKITGVVRDQSGSVMPGATVIITNAQTGVTLTATTDQDGVFTFPVLSV